MTSKAELYEKLSDVEHRRWSDWQEYVHEATEPVACPCCDDCLIEHVIPAEKYHHWARLIDTPYAHLPEHSKESDRKQVDRYWPLVVAFVAAWLAANEHEADPYGTRHFDLSDRWLDEMA